MNIAEITQPILKGSTCRAGDGGRDGVGAVVPEDGCAGVGAVADVEEEVLGAVESGGDAPRAHAVSQRQGDHVG